MSATLELSVVPRLADFSEAEWERLRGADPNPFLSWRFLSALEETGCVAADRAWWPCHLSARLDGNLVAAAPAYIKNDGMGDFSRDWAFYDAVGSLGQNLYPKLVVGIPFSPVTGRRILVAPDSGLEEQALVHAIVQIALEVCRQHELQAIQVLYHSESERTALSSAGLATRILVQYHWHNYDYEVPDDWLARLPSKRRTQARREQREPDKQGITIETIRGDALAADPARWSRTAFELYRTTCEKYMWGGTYLNRSFYDHMFTEMTDTVELVVARREGNVIAGAINLATPTHLFGRYWGCHEEHRFLHFNVCLYHSIRECIERGVQVFEGGAGGEHKVTRGFEPVATYSSLWFADERSHMLLSEALERDCRLRERQISRWQQKWRDR